MTDIATDTMTKQHNQVRARGVRISRKEPPIQPNSIAGLKINILKRPAQFGSAGLYGPARVINLAVFKPAEHYGYNQARSQKHQDLQLPPRPSLHVFQHATARQLWPAPALRAETPGSAVSTN